MGTAEVQFMHDHGVELRGSLHFTKFPAQVLHLSPEGQQLQIWACLHVRSLQLLCFCVPNLAWNA
jgi:hypothetical protein